MTWHPLSRSGFCRSGEGNAAMALGQHRARRMERNSTPTAAMAQQLLTG